MPICIRNGVVIVCDGEVGVGGRGGEEEKGEVEEGILHGCAFFRVALEYLQKILENTSSRFRQ